MDKWTDLNKVIEDCTDPYIKVRIDMRDGHCYVIDKEHDWEKSKKTCGLCGVNKIQNLSKVLNLVYEAADRETEDKIWVWIANGRCKYITLLINIKHDICIVYDREGVSVTEDVLFSQYNSEIDESIPYILRKDRMKIIKIDDKDNAVLFKDAEEITDFASMPKLESDMLNLMITSNGIGLAAPQVGKSIRMFVFRDRNDKYWGMFNPVIAKMSDKKIIKEEGCLSIPGYHIEKERSKSVKIRFQDNTGNKHTLKFEGIDAVVIQHEQDHLYGILIKEK